MQPNEWQEQEAVVERETRRYLRQTTLSQKVSQFGVFGVDLPNNIFPSGWHRRRKTRRVRLCMTAWTVSPPFPALFDRPPHRVNGFPPPPPCSNFRRRLPDQPGAAHAGGRGRSKIPNRGTYARPFQRAPFPWFLLTHPFSQECLADASFRGTQANPPPCRLTS